MKYPTPFSLDEQREDSLTPRDEVTRTLAVSQMEIAATALARLWQELGLRPIAPLLFLSSTYATQPDQHQPRLLDRAVASGQRRRRARFGQIERWQRLAAPSYAYGLAQTLISGPLLKANLLHEKRKARIEMLGDGHHIEEVIRKTTFEEEILPEEILEQVASQWRLFSKDTLARYARLGIARMREVMLVGPPGTGKTTLLNTLDGVETPDNPMGTLTACTDLAQANRKPVLWEQGQVVGMPTNQETETAEYGSGKRQSPGTTTPRRAR